MFKFNNVSKSYSNIETIKNVNFEIEDGDFFVIVGLSGSGKTTLLSMMNRLIDAPSGEILFDGKELKEWDKRALRFNMGYVLQQGALFPNLTVKENIGLLPEIKKWDKSKTSSETQRLLEKVGLLPEKYLDRYPDELSGGEKQRIGILRAIITQPKVLLMDEPFSALDPLMRKDLQEITKNLHKELGITVVFVTHDMREALKLATKICIIHEGSIIQIAGPEEILHDPANDFVRELFESEELL
ncbi:ATP-binding cassette domain-containing protein [Facklamia miroungae]|uniref:ATP-binding cassette domain-containing protein n=1 Tax=Facklamia miroungae TaxID=120956 RepID=UPI000B7D3FF2|nr:ABC transporter ATP-binding protein [Facklamia miroungae]NKZ28880.1 ABC transporter ATP-binding protein [Facklamia miroungae]